MTTTLIKKSSVARAGELFWEARVSERLGVPRKVLAKLRAELLTEGADFTRQENNAVALTSAGLQKIEAAMCQPTSDDLGADSAGKPKETAGNPATEKSSDVPAGPPARELMTVERVPQNQRILLAVTHQRTAPAIVAVRVKENVNFAPGMIFQAIESHDGVWQFHNRPTGDESTVGRLPRGKGKW